MAKSIRPRRNRSGQLRLETLEDRALPSGGSPSPLPATVTDLGLPVGSTVATPPTYVNNFNPSLGMTSENPASGAAATGASSSPSNTPPLLESQLFATPGYVVVNHNNLNN